MALLLIRRGVAFVLHVLPQGVHQLLDAWSYRVALKRREKRLKPAPTK
jgi:hypothetical protein